MRIILAEHHGLCFGVRDALRQAETLAAAGPLTVLGELVHNPLALERLHARGALQGDLARLDSAPPSARVLVTAHGASDERRRAWQNAGFQVHDTTCPLVRRAHAQLAALVAAGYFPVVIGRADHAEVRGLTGDFPGAAVVETGEDIAAVPWRTPLRGHRPDDAAVRQGARPRGGSPDRAARGGSVFPRHGLPTDERPAGGR